MRYGTSTRASGEGGAWAAVGGQGGPVVDPLKTRESASAMGRGGSGGSLWGSFWG